MFVNAITLLFAHAYSREHYNLSICDFLSAYFDFLPYFPLTKLYGIDLLYLYIFDLIFSIIYVGKTSIVTVYT
jgi:hypothetical protein